jgi:hypothetical protein
VAAAGRRVPEVAGAVTQLPDLVNVRCPRFPLHTYLDGMCACGHIMPGADLVDHRRVLRQMNVFPVREWSWRDKQERRGQAA